MSTNISLIKNDANATLACTSEASSSALMPSNGAHSVATLATMTRDDASLYAGARQNRRQALDVARTPRTRRQRAHARFHRRRAARYCFRPQAFSARSLPLRRTAPASCVDGAR